MFGYTLNMSDDMMSVGYEVLNGGKNILNKLEQEIVIEINNLTRNYFRDIKKE